MRATLFSLLAGAVLSVSSLAANADSYRDDLDGTPSAGAMAFDLLLVRPVGIAATVLGTGLFVVQLPLSLIQGTPPRDPAKKLIVEPAKFTFERPLGSME